MNRPYIFDSLSQPLVLSHHWILDAKALDFYLSKIEYLEETVGPTITLKVAGVDVDVPGGWNILIVDKETYTVDMVPVTSCAAFKHSAFVFSPQDGKLITEDVSVSGWQPDGKSVYPAMDKPNALIHAIPSAFSHGKEIARGIVIAPYDLNRQLSGKTVGDILG